MYICILYFVYYYFQLQVINNPFDGLVWFNPL